MPGKLVTSPSNLILVATGAALLLLALMSGIAAASHYPMPVDRVGGKAVAVALNCTRDAVLGTALLIVALRKSPFASATAVIVGTVLMFAFGFRAVVDVVVHSSLRTSWFDAIHLTIAASLVAPLLFPRGEAEIKPVLVWMAVTVASATILVGSLAILARL